MRLEARVDFGRQQGFIWEVHGGRARTRGRPIEITRAADDLGGSLGTSNMVVIGGGHGGEGAGDAVAMEGMVAPGAGVPEGELKAADSMVKVAAGLGDERRGGMLWNLGADEPGGEDRIRSPDLVS